MIKSLFLCFLFLISSNGIKDYVKEPEFILLARSGNWENHSKPLYISRHKLNIQLDSFRYNLLHMQQKSFSAPIPNNIYEAFLNTQYTFVITNEKTYSQIISFVYSNKKLFTKYISVNDENYSQINIHISNKTFSLFDKNIIVFFKNLKTHLTFRNCDKKVIKALNEI